MKSSPRNAVYACSNVDLRVSRNVFNSTAEASQLRALSYYKSTFKGVSPMYCCLDRIFLHGARLIGTRRPSTRHLNGYELIAEERGIRALRYRLERAGGNLPNWPPFDATHEMGHLMQLQRT